MAAVSCSVNLLARGSIGSGGTAADRHLDNPRQFVGQFLTEWIQAGVGHRNLGQGLIKSLQAYYSSHEQAKQNNYTLFDTTPTTFVISRGADDRDI